jgi:hypothetical protein
MVQMKWRSFGKAGVPVIAVLVLGLATPTVAKADLQFTLNTVFNGAAPTSTPPWLTATFAQNGADEVILTLAASLDVASEFIEEVAFNVAGTDPLTIVQDPLADPQNTSMAYNPDSVNLLGGGASGTGFDFLIKWTVVGPPTNVGRFNNSDVTTFRIQRTGLLETDFDQVNTGGANAHVAAHVQGIPTATGGTTSGAIKDGPPSVIPEPSSWALLSTALGGILWSLRKRLARQV